MSKTLAQIIGNLDKIYFVDKLKDPKVLIDFYNYYNNLNKNAALKSAKTWLKSTDLLFSQEIDPIIKKYLLIMLSFLPSPEAYKIIEQYAQQPDNELEDWAYLSLLENRALLESKLLGEPRYVISSPLGGKNKKIRLFVALKAKNNNEFSQWQKDLIKKEINFYFERNNIDLELLDIQNYYVRIVGLFPLDLDFAKLMLEIINKINEIGDFLDIKGIINNERILSPEQTKETLKDAPVLGEKDYIGLLNSAEIQANWNKIRKILEIDDDSNDLDKPNKDDNDNLDETTNTEE